MATAPIGPIAWEPPYAVGAAKRNSKKAAICELASDLSPDTESASTLILDFLVSITLRGICFYCLSHPGYGIFIIAAQAMEATFYQPGKVDRTKT